VVSRRRGRGQTLQAQPWNSLNLQVEPTIVAVAAFLIGVTTLILALEAVLRPRLETRRRRL
jgi:putative spermidine/putrescine transport system permease protein